MPSVDHLGTRSPVPASRLPARRDPDQQPTCNGTLSTLPTEEKGSGTSTNRFPFSSLLESRSTTYRRDARMVARSTCGRNQLPPAAGRGWSQDPQFRGSGPVILRAPVLGVSGLDVSLDTPSRPTVAFCRFPSPTHGTGVDRRAGQVGTNVLAPRVPRRPSKGAVTSCFGRAPQLPPPRGILVTPVRTQSHLSLPPFLAGMWIVGRPLLLNPRRTEYPQSEVRGEGAEGPGTSGGPLRRVILGVSGLNFPAGLRCVGRT